MARISLSIPPGVTLDDASFTVGQGNWTEADHVRFWRGFPQVIGGWEILTITTLSGKCRGLFNWRDNNGSLNIAFGTHTNLYVYINGDFFDITPSEFVSGLEDGTGGIGYGTGTYSTGYYSQPSNEDFFPLTWSFASFGENLIANPRGQGLWRWTNDGAVAPVTISRVAELTDDLTYADQTAADVVWTRGSGWTFDAVNDQFDAVTASADVTRSVTGLTVGKYYRVQISASNISAGSIAALEGSTPGTAIDEDGDAYVTFKASGTSATVGARGVGFTGSLDADFIVYELNAPDECTYMTVTPQRQVMVYGCNEELTDAFNPRAIRFCDFEDVTDWVSTPSNNAGEVVLDGAGALVAARETAYGAFVWTTNELYFREYVGAPNQTYRFTLVGTGCGLIGPNAAAVLGQVAYWMSPDGQFWRCPVGGAPSRVICPLQDEVTDNITTSQDAKIYAASVAEFNEIWWFYPDARDGSENSRAVALQVSDGNWSGLHTLARTAFLDAGAGRYPVGVSPSGLAYFHELGQSDNGGVLSWSLRTGDIYIAEGGKAVQVRNIWPNVEGQQGAVTLTVQTKFYPQGDYVSDAVRTLTAGDDSVDFRSTGRMVKMIFEGEAAPVSARFGPISLDVTTRGRR
jgi:hypothetical protein